MGERDRGNPTVRIIFFTILVASGAAAILQPKPVDSRQRAIPTPTLESTRTPTLTRTPQGAPDVQQYIRYQSSGAYPTLVPR